MSEIEKVKFQGASGLQHSFQVYTIGNFDTHTLGADALEDVGGVYIFTKMEANPNGVKTYSPLYIGQTQSLKQRITGQHETLPCIAQNGANRLCVLEVENLFSRQAIEADLLCRINTPCNRNILSVRVI